MDVFTSVTANYIPKARVLAWSVKKHHPEARFHLILSDTIPEWLGSEKEPFDSVITVEELPIPDKKRWLFKHSLVETCTGVKGAAALEIMRRHNGPFVIYFDPDIAIFSRLDTLVAEFEKNSVLLTPHQAEPDETFEAIVDNEICSLKHGVYNLGFLAVKNSPVGKRFLTWWADRLENFCYDDIPGGLFTDQRWIDLAPGFFEEIGVLRAPNYNVATWNLSRRIAKGSLEKGITVNGLPLCFYHFSGFDSGAQEVMLDKYGSDSPVLKKLRQWYIDECEKMGQSKYGKTPCIYQTFDNGEPITRSHRVLYRNRVDLQDAFAEPHKTGDIIKSYYHWFKSEAAGYNVESGGNLDTMEGLRDTVMTLRTELDLIKRSRSWRLAKAIAHVSKVVRGR